MVVRKGLCVIALTFCGTLVALAGFSDVYGLGEQEMLEYAQNNIMFYDSSCSSSSSGICGTNQNYAGEQVWTDEQMEALKANQPFYEKEASKYGYAWQILAAIHVRESGLQRNNLSNGQGPYQFAGSSERNKCSALNGAGFAENAKLSEEEFAKHTECVAKFLKEQYGKGLDLTKDDDIKKLFFKYNGEAGVYKKQALNLGFSKEEADNGEGSPYVVNRYDEKREPSGTWGQVKRDYGPIEYPANNDFGAFVYYKAITCGGSSSSGSNSGPSSNSSNGSTSTSTGGDGANTTIIGDSITNMSKEKILEKSPNVDIYAMDCKTVGVDFDKPCGDSTGYNESGLTIVKKLKSSGSLKDKVVFLLGTNEGGFDKLEEALDEIGTDRQIYLMSLWTRNNDFAAANKTISKLVGERSNVSLIDWGKVAKDNSSSYLESDGTHPNKAGQEAFAGLIAEAISTSSCVGVGEFTYYDQNDPRWKDSPYGSSTIGPSGCAPTAFAMAATQYLGRAITPDEVAKVAGDAGQYSSGQGSLTTVIKILAEHYGMEYEKLSAATNKETVELINKYLKDGWGIIMSGKSKSEDGGMPFTPRGHYVYIRELTSDGKWLVDDSYHTELGQKVGKSKGHPFKTVAPESAYDPSTLITNSGRLGGDQRINAIRSTASQANADCNNVCSSTGGGSVGEEGLTIEQAKQFVMYYGENKNDSSAKAVGNTQWGTCNGGGSNCVTFSAFFMKKFTSISPSGRWGNGKDVVGNLQSGNVEATFGNDPRVFAVFSTGKSSQYGHTGVILGHHDGKWIIGHASCSYSGIGKGNGGDGNLSGSHKGGGSGYIAIEESDNPEDWQWMSGKVTFAYPNEVKTAEIEEYLKNGE